MLLPLRRRRRQATATWWGYSFGIPLLDIGSFLNSAKPPFRVLCIMSPRINIKVYPKRGFYGTFTGINSMEKKKKKKKKQKKEKVKKPLSLRI